MAAPRGVGTSNQQTQGGEGEMTKGELVKAIQRATGDAQLSTKQVQGVFDTAVQEIGTVLKKEGRLMLPGLGTFTVAKRKARNGRNPQAGEIIKIKAHKTVVFRAALALKQGL
jgi:DNA-binding protein HU-beta